MQKGFSQPIILLGVLLIGLIGVGVYYLTEVKPTKDTKHFVQQFFNEEKKGETLKKVKSFPFENWMIYTSKNAKYEFLYPDDWSVTDYQHGWLNSEITDVEYLVITRTANLPKPISTEDREGIIAEIFVSKNSDTNSLEEYKNNSLGKEVLKDSIRFTTVGGEKALTYKIGTGGFAPNSITIYVILKNDFVYDIRLLDSIETKKNREQNIELFDQIILTFKFLK